MRVLCRRLHSNTRKASKAEIKLLIREIVSKVEHISFTSDEITDVAELLANVLRFYGRTSKFIIEAASILSSFSDEEFVQ